MGANVSAIVEYNPREGLDQVHPVYAVILGIVLGAITVTGSLGNILTLLAIGLNKQLQKSYTVYVAHLAVVDLVICGCLVPSNIYGILVAPPSTCGFQSAMSLCCSLVSIQSLMFISINRYVLICKDRHTYERFFTRRKVAASVVFMWLYALTVVLPMEAFGGLGWSVKYVNCIFKSYRFDVYLYTVVCISFAGLVVPICITAFGYFHIIRKMKETAEKVRPAAVAVTETAVAEPSSSMTSEGGKRKAQPNTGDLDEYDEDDSGRYDAPSVSTTKGKMPSMAIPKQAQDRHLAKRRANNRRIMGLIAIFMIFVLCWLPLAVTFIFDVYQTLPGWLNVTFMATAWVNSSVNVYLYAYTNQNFRHAFKCILKCRFSQINRM